MHQKYGETFERESFCAAHKVCLLFQFDWIYLLNVWLRQIFNENIIRQLKVGKLQLGIFQLVWYFYQKFTLNAILQCEWFDLFMGFKFSKIVTMESKLSRQYNSFDKKKRISNGKYSNLLSFYRHFLLKQILFEQFWWFLFVNDFFLKLMTSLMN